MRQATIAILFLIMIFAAEANKSHLTNNNSNNKAIHRNTKKQTEEAIHNINRFQNNIKIQQDTQVTQEQESNADGEAEVQAEVSVDVQDGEQQQETDVVEVGESDDGQIVAEYVSPVNQTPESAWQNIASEHDTFEAFYAAYKQKLQDDLDALVAEKSSKNGECSAYGVAISDLEVNITKSQDYITWLSEKITQNTAKIDKIFAERCEAHQIFIEYYKNAKVTLRLIAFLREAIQNYSMIQLKSVGTILSEFMNPRLLNNADAMKAMLAQLKEVDGTDTYDSVGDSLEEQERQRTQEEIGNQHIDNDREQINVDEYESSERRLLDDYKQEITKILDDIRANTQSEINRRQDDEIELNDRVVKFVQKMEIENANLTQEAERTREALIEMEADLETTVYLQETCWGDLQWLEDEVVAQTEIQTYVVTNTEEIKAQYDALRKSQAAASGELAQSITLEPISEPISVITEPVEENDDSSPDTSTWVPGADSYDLNTVDPSKGIKIPATALEKLTVGLSWDAGETDLDSSVLITNSEFDVVDRVYWNNLVSKDYSVESLGDARTGDAAGDDESINVFLNSVDSEYRTLFFSISIYDEDNIVFFQDVSMAKVTLYVDGNVFTEYQIDPTSTTFSEWATTYLLVELYRNDEDEGAWYLRPTDVWVYQNPDKSPIRGANEVGLDMQIKNIGQGKYIQETQNWQTTDGTFTLPYGGNGLAIPSVGLTGLTLGLAWDAGNTDLDGSILMADQEHVVVDRVYWNKSTSNDLAIEHMGDARTGESGGDDETINVNLSEVDQNVKHLYILLTIYDDQDTLFFNNVNNMKVSLYIQEETFLEFQLDPSQIRAAKGSPAYILVEVYRNATFEGNWWIRQVGNWLYKGPQGINIRGANEDGIDQAIAEIVERVSTITVQTEETVETQEEVVETQEEVVETQPDTTAWVPGEDSYDLTVIDPTSGIKIPDTALEKLTIGLSWDAGQTDLDSSVVATNSDFDVVDRVYWNNLVSNDESIESLGDARTGDAEGDDESINVYLNSVDSSYQTLFIAISIYDDDNLVFFQDVSMAKVTLYVDGNVFTEYQIDPSSSQFAEWATTYLLVELYRNANDEGAWYLRPTDVWVYQNPDKSPIRSANNVGLDMQIKNIGTGTYVQETLEWQATDGTFTLPYGGNGLAIPTVGLSGLTLGLAWDAGNTDLDGSILMANSDNQVVDRVYWNKSASDDYSVEHMGDARTGEAGGDDETIQLGLENVDSSINHLYVLLTIYDDNDQIFFNDVNNVKVSLYIGGVTFLEFQLDTSQIEAAKGSPAYVLVEIYRNSSNENNWWIKQVGEWLYKGPQGQNIRGANDNGVNEAIAQIKQ